MLPSLPQPQKFFVSTASAPTFGWAAWQCARTRMMMGVKDQAGTVEAQKSMSEGRQRRTGAQDLSDVELVNQLVEGKQAAFPIFYARYARLIRHCITKRTHLEADDLMQDFFVKLQANKYRALDGWNRVTPLTNYISFIVKNFVIDEYRRSCGRRPPNRMETVRDWMRRVILGSGRTGEEDTGEDDSEQVSDWHAPPDARLERLALRRKGVEAWARLSSPRDRRLICGKFHRDTPAEQAALVEGLSSGTFRKAVFDAQKRYMALLRNVAPEFFA